MHVLILSCNTGGGHNACGRAIQEICDTHGVACDSADAVCFVSEKLSRFMAWGHTTMYRKIPGLMDKGYTFFEKHPAQTAEDSAVAKLFASGADRLREYILESGADTVICTHPFSAAIVTAIQRNDPLPIKTALVATDYTCSPLVQESVMDIHFIPAESIAHEFICDNIPYSKIAVSGIPIEQTFYTKEEMNYAKAYFGIPADVRHLVMMCGSMGCGPMEDMLETLSNDGSFHITVVCGTNEKLREKLTKHYREMPHVHIHGFVKKVSLLLDSADLFLTKPGGISTTEGAVKAVPMVFIDTVAACESYNMNFFVNAGGAVASDDPDTVCRYCISLMKDPVRTEAMAHTLQALDFPNAAECIFETMRELAGSQ